LEEKKREQLEGEEASYAVLALEYFVDLEDEGREEDS
jgi:hypothetical protein